MSGAALDRLFRPRRVAVVGASPNDPRRMGTRTMHDLVESGFGGEVYPVSARHAEICGRRAFPSLREVPASPDVVLARVPAASVRQVVDDACAVGAGSLVVLASGFAESGASGQEAQRDVLAAARAGGLRILGPQSIGLVNVVDGIPLSLSQIMERLAMRAGRVALVTQSGAMAIALSVRGQEEYGVDFSYVLTLGNAADIDVPESLEWLAGDPHTAVVGLYLEAAGNLRSFARAILACREAGKHVVVLRSGLSSKGAKAVASHTASLAGDGRVFAALCNQLGVVLVDSGESFLVALKALSGRVPAAPVRTAFASVSGGACALWADGAERAGYALPDLAEDDASVLATRLPAFLKPGNPLDLGPAMFDAGAFEASIRALAGAPRFDLLVAYLFTSSPTLMGGLARITQLEALAAASPIPVWVAWEAATPEEWARLARSASVTAFRELGQATQAAGFAVVARQTPRYIEGCGTGKAAGMLGAARSEAQAKAALRAAGLPVPDGEVARDGAAALRIAEALGGPVVLKVAGEAIAHKSELGGVVPCPEGAPAVPAAFRQLVDNLATHGVDGEAAGVYVERMVTGPGLELFVTVRHADSTGWVTTVGRGGTAIEVERDFAMRLGLLEPADVTEMLRSLRCFPLLAGFRGTRPLDADAFAELVAALPAVVGDGGGGEIELELNPVKVTPDGAWILDALVQHGGEVG